MRGYYDEDLAYVHDQGFSNFAEQAAITILNTLKQSKLNTGLVVDLGCGSGVVARELSAAGYDILGVDTSPYFIQLAQDKVPRGHFIQASLYDVDLPECICVVSTSECLNYVVSEESQLQLLGSLFQRVYSALSLGGQFIFDVLIQDKRLSAEPKIGWYDQADWTMLVKTTNDFEKDQLTRDVILFRKIDGAYRKSTIQHLAYRYNLNNLLHRLKQVGFKVKQFGGYGDLAFEAGHVGFCCEK